MSVRAEEMDLFVQIKYFYQNSSRGSSLVHRGGGDRSHDKGHSECHSVDGGQLSCRGTREALLEGDQEDSGHTLDGSDADVDENASGDGAPSPTTFRRRRRSHRQSFTRT